MATLQVTNLQNIAAGANTNVSLLADGSTTLVLNATGTSRTGGIRYNAGTLEVYNGTAWVSAGGGSGTVTGVTASLPLVSSGGAAPNLTINPATTSLPGSVQLADAAASQAGTSATLVSTPAFAVPKDAANMTGAALIPGGVDGGRPGTPSGGMFRYNTTLSPDSMEFYDAGQAAWIALATLPQLQGVALDSYSNFSPSDGGITDFPVMPGSVVRNTINVPAGYTNFMVYSAIAMRWAYNTTGSGVSLFNRVEQNGVELGFQASNVSNSANFEQLQVGTSVFVATTSAVGVANTFTQVVNKDSPQGPVTGNDSSLVVLAWTI